MDRSVFNLFALVVELYCKRTTRVENISVELISCFILPGGGYFYDGYCIETDRYLYEHDDFLILFAAGECV